MVHLTKSHDSELAKEQKELHLTAVDTTTTKPLSADLVMVAQQLYSNYNTTTWVTFLQHALKLTAPSYNKIRLKIIQNFYVLRIITSFPF